MQTHRMLFALSGLLLLAGGGYLLWQVMDEPKAPEISKQKEDKARPAAKTTTGPRSAAVDTPVSDIVLPNEIREAPSEHNNGRTFIRRSTSPDRLPDGSERPKPFQARSEPAKNHALFVGVKTREMEYRVDNVNGAYLRGEYETVISEATQLIEEIPENQQLKRLLIRAACLAKKPDIARAWLPKVSESDQVYMRSHCKTYGSPLD